MTLEEAMAALPTTNPREILVRTRSGAVYSVGWDTLECYGEGGYVYGYRENGNTGPLKRRTAGEYRWFALKNVTLVQPE